MIFDNNAVHNFSEFTQIGIGPFKAVSDAQLCDDLAMQINYDGCDVVPGDIQTYGIFGVISYRKGCSFPASGISDLSVDVNQAFIQKTGQALSNCGQRETELDLEIPFA